MLFGKWGWGKTKETTPPAMPGEGESAQSADKPEPVNLAVPAEPEDKSVDHPSPPDQPTEPAAAVEPAAAPEPAAPRVGFFRRIAQRLVKTRETLVKRVRRAIKLRARLDDDLLDELEEILVQADVGIETTTKIINDVRLEARAGDPADVVIELMKKSIGGILRRHERAFAIDPARRPYVVLVVGVNGTGKTTTIGKIAQKLRAERRRVMLVAGDTFRAAAIEQLEIWGQRTGSPVVRREMGSDSAAVCYEALQQALREDVDVVLIDTAGRLHTKKELMDELEKVVRVIRKVIPEAPHETLLVLDATTGQNAIMQARVFSERCGVSGLVMTKLDGTAKGGVLIALRDLFEIPVLMIGIGEGADDLRPFDADEFTEALFTEDADNGGAA